MREKGNPPWELVVERFAEAEVYNLSRLCKEVSAVINRVRAAFDSVPMWEVFDRPEIKEAEQILDLEVKRMLQGETDLAAWRRALDAYEAAWMSALADDQNPDGSAPCPQAGCDGVMERRNRRGGTTETGLVVLVCPRCEHEEVP